MAFLVVDKDGTEWISNVKPFRYEDYDGWGHHAKIIVGYNVVQLPPGTIEKLIGKKMTWLDEPHELKSDK